MTLVVADARDPNTHRAHGASPAQIRQPSRRAQIEPQRGQPMAAGRRAWPGAGSVGLITSPGCSMNTALPRR